MMTPIRFTSLCCAASLLAAAVDGGSVSVPPPVIYDFTAGDTLEAKGGWAFENTTWTLFDIPGTAEKGLRFTYSGVKPGEYGMSEMRFSMPPADAFWLGFRWHIPKNYTHRHDTHIGTAGAAAAGWQLGDTVRGTDNASTGVISGIDDKGVFLRNAVHPDWNGVWVGDVTNVTRSSKLPSTSRAQHPANNKLLAIWADGYSSKGLGSTIVWQTDMGPYGATWRDSEVTVGYSVGNHTVTRGPASAGTLIRAADAGTAMDLLFHVRCSSKPGAKDGVIRSWARRQGEKTYTQYHNITNAEIDKRSDTPADQQPWCHGYLMGWANSGYDVETAFHISRVAWYGSEPAELGGTPVAK